MDHNLDEIGIIERCRAFEIYILAECPTRRPEFPKMATDLPAIALQPDPAARRLEVPAIPEPPFLIGTSCGSCHIAFDPLNPPADPAHPKWENIKGLIGNQYTRMSELLGSGMPATSLEWQMFAHPRPGVTDTSAISHDQINNPGTINALFNVSQRPTFEGEMIMKWRKAATCGAEKDEEKCWCEPKRDGKCWARSARNDDKTQNSVLAARCARGLLETLRPR